MPLGLAHGLDSYLHNYPNGCSEQITSGGILPAMLADESDFGLKRPEIAEKRDMLYQVLQPSAE